MHHVALEQERHTRIVVASGELDAFAAPDLESAFAEVRGEQFVVTDLARVAFMDSTVLGLLVRATRELAKNGAQVRVVLPAGVGRRIFEITALDRILPIAATRDAALADLDRSG